MLTRSLYKPLVTFSKNSTITLFRQLKSTDVDSSVVEQPKFLGLNTRINSFLSRSEILIQSKPKAGLHTVAVPASFGATFVKKNVTKVVSQVLGAEVPAFVTFGSKAIISISLCGKRVAIYNGKLLMPVLLKRSMLGFSFKQMVRCKRLGRIIHAKVAKGGGRR